MLTRLQRAEQERIDAEAAVWLAHLQGPDRTPASERKFRQWADADARHSVAFERATEIWEMLPGAAALAKIAPPQKSRRNLAFAGAVFAVVLAVAIAAIHFCTAGPIQYATEVGEQQSVVLSAGSRIPLNTDSAVRVRYSSGERLVELERGEAMFDVHKNPERPFVVLVDDERVRALGTSFVIRREPSSLAVTLVTGRVEVSRDQANRPMKLAVLEPGERLTIYGDDYARIDHPPVSEIAAWLRGEVIFNDMPLIQAAREVTRYAPHGSIRVAPSIGSLRISGIFKLNDIREFVVAVAALHDLQMIQKDDNYVIWPQSPEKVNNKEAI